MAISDSLAVFKYSPSLPPQITPQIPSVYRKAPLLPPIRQIHITNMAAIHEPTKEEAIALFESIEKKFPHGTLGDDKWYLVTVSWQTSIEIFY